jgi:hypothetical protein
MEPLEAKTKALNAFVIICKYISPGDLPDPEKTVKLLDAIANWLMEPLPGLNNNH